MQMLDTHSQLVMNRALDEECEKREHVVIALSGAHAYGFPSPDSDLDLKAIHIASTEEFLGFGKAPSGVDRLEVVEGVEIDYTSNEIGGVLAGILGGNGNYIERVLGAMPIRDSDLNQELRPLVQASLSKRVYRHYRGFALSQKVAFEQAAEPTAKKILYVLRTALTGTHLLQTGELQVDVNPLLEPHGFGEAAELIQAKTKGEQSVLAPEVRERWLQRIGQAFETLDKAHEASSLPEEAPNAEAIEAWLVRARRERLG